MNQRTVCGKCVEYGRIIEEARQSYSDLLNKGRVFFYSGDTEPFHILCEKCAAICGEDYLTGNVDDYNCSDCVCVQCGYKR